MALTIISLIKQVPLPTEMRMGEDGLMDRTKAKSIINIDCQFGLEAGLQLKKQYPDARLIACSMGPQSFEVALRTAISMGYDEAFLLSDRKLGGSDTYATGLAISTMLKHLGFTKDSKEPFIILAGRQTSDGDTAHVPSQVAENIGIPQATFVESVKADGEGNVIAKRIIEGGYQMMKLPMPCTISLTPTGIPPRKPSLVGAIKARNAKITVFGIDDIGLGTEKIGLTGSPTIVANVVNIVSERAPITMSSGHDEVTLVDNLIANFKKGGNVLEKKEKVEKKVSEAPDFPYYDNRNGAKGIITWAEIANGKIARPSIELLTPARKLADQLGNDTKIMTLLIGKNVKDQAQTLFEHGSDEVIVVEDDRLEEYLVLPFSSIFAQVIKERNPEIALFAATTSGRELAPRIGVKTGSGVTADCTGLEIGEYVNRKEKVINKPILFSRRPTYGESKLATILGFVYPQISTARAGTFEVPARMEGRTGVLSTYKPILTDKEFTVEILQTVRGGGGLQNLFDADIIVSGGRGTTGDGLELVKKLADALVQKGIKAEWACSRVVVDEGYSEYARQVGQTGKTVRPKVYVAIGISGAIQHIAGMKESEKIIAIDHNPKASIFHFADFGIVGEYQDILPELIDRVNGGFTFGIEPIRN
ncbi:electron transfer flavoprotein, alpha subunit [Aquipluma nitroreducens]|uniref:Electron transfer flavoprotein, alpha subunit n=1 Tax=Aquipluma nitroreducens TaxID=2010828 RepID=A0A5K7SDH9_9BACT|nr:FAD-binding protein [Aquipluma nitroreducens]BBE19535.1 electron transfer flavoprotein, alpha subunit [Aquipluma nitroreducens]